MMLCISSAPLNMSSHSPLLKDYKIVIFKATHAFYINVALKGEDKYSHFHGWNGCYLQGVPQNPRKDSTKSK